MPLHLWELLPAVSLNSGMMCANALIATVLYTPQIARLMRLRNSQGVSEVTWIMKLGCNTSSVLYTLHRGQALVACIDLASLMLQGQLIAALLLYFGSPRQRRVLMPCLSVYSLWLAAYMASAIGDTVISGLQLAVGVLSPAALAPQIVMNWQRGSAGEFSPLTCFGAIVFCCIRALSIALGPRDPLLFLPAFLTLCVTLLLGGQILFYRRREGSDVCSTLTSDLFAPQQKKVDDVAKNFFDV